MLHTIHNCCSKSYLDSMMLLSQRSDQWNFRYPEGKPFEQRFAKINLVPDNQNTSLAGMAMGLLLQIYDAGGYKYFQPEVKFCGISVKGQGSDDPHTDTWDTDTVKVLGLLNSDWNYSDVGGGFMYDGKEYDLKPTSFIIFDSNKVHCATKIYTNKKRFAIDYAVKKI